MNPSGSTPSRVLGFSVVGGIGFLVDGGLLTWLVLNLDVNVYIARLLSFSVATIVTWQMNRKYVFDDLVGDEGANGSEYVRYVVVQITGGLTNLGVFVVVVALFPGLQLIPIVPLAVGAAFGLLVNFSGSRYWVFR